MGAAARAPVNVEDIAAAPWGALGTIAGSVMAAIGAVRVEQWKDRKAKDDAASKVEIARIASQDARFFGVVEELKSRLATAEARNDECEIRARAQDVKIARLTGTQYTLLADIAMLRATLAGHKIPIPEPPLIDEARLPALWPKEP